MILPSPVHFHFPYTKQLKSHDLSSQSKHEATEKLLGLIVSNQCFIRTKVPN